MTAFPRFPPVPPALRQGRGWLVRTAGSLFLRLGRWRFEGEFPRTDRFVAIVAPHTSNWDFFLGVAAVFALELKASWLGKHGIFRFPVRGLLERLGGIPVDRRANFGVVEACVERFRATRPLMLALSPEGTRRSGGRWRSGFYQIAHGAGVPILPIAFDFRTRCIRLLPTVSPTGDLAKDLPAIQALFQGVTGCRPPVAAPAS